METIKQILNQDFLMGVQNRIDNNEINYDTVVPTKSVMKIIHSNVYYSIF